ncbi:MAG: hypothetical protein WA364_12335 [Candidatus Nitrosopolaris sp.]
MKPINVELTMGHDIGVSASYYRLKYSYGERSIGKLSSIDDIVWFGYNKGKAAR